MTYLLEGFSSTISSKVLGVINIRCCICKDSTQCIVEEWVTRYRFLFIPILRRLTGYSFRWTDCYHQLGFNAPKKILQYQEKARDYRTVPIPSCEDLIPVRFEERGILPEDRTARIVAILLTLLFISMFLALACTLLGDLLVLLI